MNKRVKTLIVTGALVVSAGTTAFADEGLVPIESIPEGQEAVVTPEVDKENKPLEDAGNEEEVEIIPQEPVVEKTQEEAEEQPAIEEKEEVVVEKKKQPVDVQEEAVVEDVVEEPIEEVQEEVVETQEEQVKEEYTAKDLEEDLESVDNIGVLANEVEVNSDIETNIVTKEANINNVSLGNTDNVKEDDEKDNVNQIEHVENIGNEARQGTTIQVGEEHEITNGDNGNDVRLDGKKVGMTKDVTVEHIDENDKVDIDKELENLEEVGNNLGELESNTNCEQVEGTTNHYNVTPFENIDEFTVIWFKVNQLESDNEYHIATEENKNVIINIDSENEEDIKVTARFEFDGVKADWNDISSKILWNFMNFGGTIDTGNIRMGTILAPNADVYVGGEPVNGSIWCNKLTGNRNEIHKVDFKVITNEEVDPEEPDVPVVPDVPEEPDVPVVPEDPEEPDVPVVPEDPEEPDVPVVPEDPENKIEKLPQTGSVINNVTATVTSLFGMIAGWFGLKKRR